MRVINTAGQVLQQGGGGGGGLTNINVSAGTTSNLLSALTFSNANGVSFGLNASTITGSVATGLSNIRVSAGTTSNLLSDVTFSNAGGVSFGLNASTITAAGLIAGMSTEGNTYGTSGMESSRLVLAALGAAGITGETLPYRRVWFGVGNVYFDFSLGNTAGSLTLVAVPPVATTNVHTEFLYYAGGNNITLSGSTSAAGVSRSQTISIVGPTVASSLTNINVSAGTTSNDLSALVLFNSNNVSFGLDGSTITATATVATSLSNIRVSAGTTSNLLSAVTFSNSNGISFGLNASTVTASHNGITSQSNQQMTLFATGNTTQSSTGTTNASSVIFRGDGVASVGITNGSVVISVPSGGGGLTNINVSAGTTSNNLSNVVFSNSNGVSFGLNGSTVTASVAAGAGGATRTYWWNMDGVTQLGTVFGSSFVSILPLNIQQDIAFSRVQVAGSISAASAANTSSAYLALSISGVFYTRNGATLSSLLSGSNTLTAFHQSNSTSSVAGPHQFTFSVNATTLAAGEYWLAVHLRTTNTFTTGNTTALGKSISMLGVGFGSAAAGVRQWNVGTNSTQGVPLGKGILSTGATRASIAFSAFTVTGTRGVLANIFVGLHNDPVF